MQNPQKQANESVAKILASLATDTSFELCIRTSGSGEYEEMHGRNVDRRMWAETLDIVAGALAAFAADHGDRAREFVLVLDRSIIVASLRKEGGAIAIVGTDASSIGRFLHCLRRYSHDESADHS
jgi:hypothetical protein